MVDINHQRKREADLVAVLNRVKACLDYSGAVTMSKAWGGIKGGYATDYAASLVYRLVELGEIEKVSPEGTWQQNEVFVAPRRN